MSRRLIHRAVIHRHGDRTPITAVGSASFWERTLPTSSALSALAQAFPVRRGGRTTSAPGQGRLARDQDAGLSAHPAGGVPPYGQLTAVGVDQLTKLGWDLRQSLSNAGAPRLDADRIRCFATPFSRTIMSAQALLTGLLRVETSRLGAHPSSELRQRAIRRVPCQVDTSIGELLLPDPEPRHWRQLELEAAHWADPAVLDEEAAVADLAARACEGLVRGGVVESVEALGRADGNGVSWNRLAEISKCYAVHGDGGGDENASTNILPLADVDEICGVAARRWFALFRKREVARYAIGGLLSKMLRGATESLDRAESRPPSRTLAPALHLYSAHDSTLIALICALQLRHSDGRVVDHWPAYASDLQLSLYGGDGEEPVFVATLDGEEMILDGTACRAATRVNALISQPFDAYGDGGVLAYPVDSVVADAADVLAAESRDVEAIDAEEGRWW